MEILPYAPELANDVTSLYNHTVQGVPYCHPIDASPLNDILSGVTWPFRGSNTLGDGLPLVARESSGVVGFVHAALEYASEDVTPTGRGIVSGLIYRRTFRAAGQALLEAAEAHLKASGALQITACSADYRYPFYHVNNGGLSNHLDHVQALFGVNGYDRSQGEIFFNWPSFEPPEPAPVPFDLTCKLEWKQENGNLPGLYMQAFEAEKQAGEFIGICAGDNRDDVALQEWFFVNWLGIGEEYQGKGIGKYLLHRGLLEGRRKGYRHAIISTRTDNWRAYNLYSNWGFRAADWTYAFEKHLQGEAVA